MIRMDGRKKVGSQRAGVGSLRSVSSIQKPETRIQYPVSGRDMLKVFKDTVFYDSLCRGVRPTVVCTYWFL